MINLRLFVCCFLWDLIFFLSISTFFYSLSFKLADHHFLFVHSFLSLFKHFNWLLYLLIFSHPSRAFSLSCLILTRLEAFMSLHLITPSSGLLFHHHLITERLPYFTSLHLFISSPNILFFVLIPPRLLLFALFTFHLIPSLFPVF